MKDEIKKQLLEIIRDLDGDGYSLSIIEELKRRTGKGVSIGKMYLWLYQLEEQDFITSTAVVDAPTGYSILHSGQLPGTRSTTIRLEVQL